MAGHARRSHVKLMVVDGRVGIQGSGNMDTQSWFHSMEGNVMVESEEVCGKWLEALGSGNANTGLFGAVDGRDGVWRDGEGREVEGSLGAKGGGWRGWVRGAMGAVKRVRGTGGF